MKEIISKPQFQSLLFDGISIMVGGFLSNGSPETLIDWVKDSHVLNLTIICNDGGYPDKGVGKLVSSGQVKKLIASHIGTNPLVGELMQKGEIEVLLVPQGTLVEQIRAGGAGLGGILTQTGLNTVVENGKQVIRVKGIDYLLEEALTADMALLGGCIADQYGNLSYIETMRNFNPVMALSGKIVVAEAREIVDSLNPECIITPHPLVDYVMVGEFHGR